MKTEFSLAEIKSKLADYNPEKKHLPEGFKPASVLVPFYETPEGLSIILMKRPENQGPHGGQISFPGGSRDEQDTDDLSVALRETEEEIGVDRDQIEVWGGLKAEYTSISRFWISPFVGSVPYPWQFQPNESEVERLLVVPFSHLIDSATFSVGTYRWKGFEVPSYLFNYKEDVIWGLTARILNNLILLLSEGKEADSRWPPS